MGFSVFHGNKSLDCICFKAFENFSISVYLAFDITFTNMYKLLCKYINTICLHIYKIIMQLGVLMNETSMVGKLPIPQKACYI